MIQALLHVIAHQYVFILLLGQTACQHRRIGDCLSQLGAAYRLCPQDCAPQQMPVQHSAHLRYVRQAHGYARPRLEKCSQVSKTYLPSI